MKTSELIGPALDWAVAKCEGEDSQAFYYYAYDNMPLYLDEAVHPMWQPSTNWAQGGEIIEREQMDVLHYPDQWVAQLWANRNWRQTIPSAPGHEKVRPLNSAFGAGPTMLIAAMRCYVASKLGDEVDVPKVVE